MGDPAILLVSELEVCTGVEEVEQEHEHGKQAGRPHIGACWRSEKPRDARRWPLYYLMGEWRAARVDGFSPCDAHKRQ
jgi:hypothetical protein